MTSETPTPPGLPVARKPGWPSTGLAGGLLLLALLGGLSQWLGAYWDVGYHEVVERDRFWSPPHIFIYAGAAILWIAGVLGFRAARRQGAPSGTTGARSRWVPGAGPYLALIGPTLQGIAGPIDELMHRALGPDTTIWAPPHQMAVWGGVIAVLGWTAVLADHLAAPGTADAPSAGPVLAPRPGGWLRPLLMVLFAILLVMSLFMLGEFDHHMEWRQPLLYLPFASLLSAWVLVLGAAVLAMPGAATAIAAIYSIMRVGVAGWLAAMQYPIAVWPVAILPAAVVLDCCLFARTDARDPAGVARARPRLAGALFGSAFAITDLAIRVVTAGLPPPGAFAPALLASAGFGLASASVGHWVAAAVFSSPGARSVRPKAAP